jgi:hypothetical protein
MPLPLYHLRTQVVEGAAEGVSEICIQLTPSEIGQFQVVPMKNEVLRL